LLHHSHEKLKAANSLGQAYGIIAQSVLDLNDSHTLFFPPERAATIEYGWQMQIFGDKAFISAVKPGSDAEAQGIKPGDMVISIDGFKPSRENAWRMKYGYYTIRPQAAVRLLLQNPKGEERQLDVKATVT
jgi:Periplasmic protease